VRKIVLVGDLHLRAKKMADISTAWARTVKWAKDKQVDLLVQAGDVFDRPNVFGKEADVGTVYGAFLDPIRSGDALRTIVIPGNHDMGGPRDKDNLTPFDGHEIVSVAHRPEVILPFPDLAICAVPWVNKAQLVARLVDRGMDSKKAARAVSEAFGQLLAKLTATVAEHKNAGRFVLFVGHLEVTGAFCANGERQANGSFEFSPKALASVGAGAYALAHLHVRQHIDGLPNENDGYLGPLCQLDFGEEKVQPGFRYMEINGKVLTDKFINNSSSPRYYTTHDLLAVDYRPGIDYVKLRSETKPERLPAGVIFDKVPQAKDSQPRRASELLSSDTALEQLLRVWKDEHPGCVLPLDDLASTANAIMAKAELPADAVGALDRLTRIFLTNITSHASTEIDLSGMTGVCGVEGPNGAGKTSAMEAMLVAFYGQCPSRPSLPLLVRNNEDASDALIELGFRVAGKEYLIRREFKKTAKTFSHKAYLVDTGTKDALAGPKVEDVRAACSVLIGDPQLVMAGIFSSQGESGNLVDLDPAPRKDLFAKLLGTDKFIILSRMADKEAKADNALVEAKKQQALGIRNELGAEATDRMGLLAGQEALKAKKAELSDVEAELARQKSKAEMATAVKEQRARALQRKADLKAQMEEIRSRGKVLRQQKDALDLLDEEDARKRVEELRAARTATDAMQDDVAKAKEASAQLALEASQATSAAHAKSVKRMQARSEAVVRETSQITLLKAEREARRRQLVDRLKALEMEAQSAAQATRNAERKADLLAGFPDLPACAACPLAKDGLEARNNLPETRVAAERTNERITNGNLVISRYDEQTDDMVSKLRVVPDEDHWQPEKSKEIAELSSKADELLAESNRTKPSLAELNQLAGMRQKAAGLPEAEKQLEMATKAAAELSRIEALLSSAKDLYRDLAKEAEALEVPEDPNLSVIMARLSVVQEQADALRGQAEHASMQIGRLQERMEQHAQRRRQLEAIEKDVAERSAAVAAYNALADAFGRDGIPQLIVDSTIPHFQDIMSDLMREFDGKWQVNVRSQREAKGEMKEVIDILVDDGYGERDIKTYSGGEKKLLKAIIRIAFSSLQAERSGKGLKVLVLDEATDALDEANASAFVRMLGRLSDRFNQVFVVSHNDHVLSSLPSRIIFSRETDHTTVVSTF
jgi:DNA repair exonuclease SbcCD ATPase subunit/DNA repair exonuclease SbcCD nuclease subunit